MQGQTKMPNKNIYVSEADLPLFEEAQALAGGKLSAVIARALRQFVETEQARQNGFEEITVKVNTEGFSAKKRFRGRLLTKKRLREQRGKDSRILSYAIYQTPKGKWGVWLKDVPSWWYRPSEMYHQPDWSEESDEDWDESNESSYYEHEYRLDVYDTQEDLQAHLPEQVYVAVCQALEGEPGGVELLDL